MVYLLIYLFAFKCPAIIITGGDTFKQSAEVFLPSTNSSCQLHSLYWECSSHTQNGPLLCGSSYRDGAHDCLNFNSSSGWFEPKHHFMVDRSSHVSWTVDDGTILMGGSEGGFTSEIAKHDGTVEWDFYLQYDTRYKEQDIFQLIASVCNKML